MSLAVHLLALYPSLLTKRKGASGNRSVLTIELRKHAQHPGSLVLSGLGAKRGKPGEAKPIEEEVPVPQDSGIFSTALGDSPYFQDFGWIPYIASADLDVKPQVMVDFPDDPEDLREFTWTGSLTVTLWINNQGRVDEAQIEASDAPPEFVERARNHFRNMVFEPGMKDGVKVAVEFRILANFLPKETPANIASPRGESTPKAMPGGPKAKGS